MGFHQTYLSLVDEIERQFPVTQWRYGDVDIWPLARMDLYLELYWQANGDRPENPVRRYLRKIVRAAGEIRLRAPSPVTAAFLGNGVSFELVDGSWRDRFCDPLIAAMEERGSSWFLMGSGEPQRRRPQYRPVHSTHLVEVAGHFGARFLRLPMELPAHDGVLTVLARSGIVAQSLSVERLVRRARIVSATASAFQRILRRLRPSLGFVVTWYAGLGPAFVLACRRERILSVDLQHCPQGLGHKAYRWSALPHDGYSTMPAVFWNWTKAEAAAIDRWAGGLVKPWHRGFHGGSLSLAGYHKPDVFVSLAGPRREKEILVALQSLEGHQSIWHRLAGEIARSPPGWRWWIRRHPAAHPKQDRQYNGLLQLSGPNVVLGPAADTPLPILLPNMDAVVSLASGTALDASTYGVPALFLDRDARALFSELFVSGQASLLEDLSQLNEILSGLGRLETEYNEASPPGIPQSLACLAGMASDYQKLFVAADSSCGAE